ncbi:hypothetical protein [Marinibacterium profundimaris]|uniref:Uncharacterized protein n=1 Tax=Marinibacterium profundimaris TaxID=1679460 RepID=A0A225NNF3_9RHOB|nr:hypothetical protein [Marinibacterium profundimaris]OWU75965.1 hypothetical protein ATO3_07265 [Marinibacterium profundimaris]
MRKLYLHIGHSKTGSSFLQASFANSVDVLAAHGIDYPGDPSEAATGWKISSGNGQALLTDPPEAFSVTRDRVFFSAERLFRAFAVEPDWSGRLAAFCAHHDIGEVEVLMFLRDPIPHAESSYQQMVKRGGATESVEATFANYAYPELVRDALKRDYGAVPVTWHLFNYDRHKTELIEITERFLDLPAGSLVRGGDRPVNRSMTASELTVLRGLNAHDPRAASALADALCNEVPDVDSETVFPARPVQREMLRRLSRAMAEVDAMLDEGERYGTELCQPAREPRRHVFTPQQIEILTGVLGRRVSGVTLQMQMERVRRLINVAQLQIHRERIAEAEDSLMRAQATLQGLDPEAHPDVAGLTRMVNKLRAGLAARPKIDDQAAAQPQVED